MNVFHFADVFFPDNPGESMAVSIENGALLTSLIGGGYFLGAMVMSIWGFP